MASVQHRLQTLAGHLLSTASSKPAAASVETEQQFAATPFMTDLRLQPSPIEEIVVQREHPPAGASMAEKVDFFRECGYVRVIRLSITHSRERLSITSVVCLTYAAPVAYLPRVMWWAGGERIGGRAAGGDAGRIHEGRRSNAPFVGGGKGKQGPAGWDRWL